MKEKNKEMIVETYFKLGLEQGHSLSSLTKALLDQGIEKSEISRAAKLFQLKEKEERKKKQVQERQKKEQENKEMEEELYASFDTSTRLGKIKFHLHKHAFIYIASFYVIYAVLLVVQAMAVWSRRV
jgi:hypothetical protein